ncbi:hypothetical protein WJX74_002610 [Apatococcus lobatus]|uniref:Uncharacterized protein n=1 Tax=Apatococcus lobatus TaxID=904363 RepID=A0AAW1SF52_9CHLO
MSSKRKSLPTTGRGSIANFFKPATQESKTSQAPPALKSPCKLQGLNRKQPLQPQELNTPLQPPSCASGQKRMPSPANAPSNKKQKVGLILFWPGYLLTAGKSAVPVLPQTS